MSLRALILDVDGTLAETEEAHRAAFNESFAAWGLDWQWDPDDYRELLATAGGRDRIRAFQATLPAAAPRLDADAIERLHAAKTARFGARLAERGLAPRPGVIELIEHAEERGLRLAVATTSRRPNLEAVTAALWGCPPERLFEAIATGDEVAAQKPAPDLYRLALARLGLPPDACLAIEDSATGLAAARAAGLDTLVAPSAYSAGDAFDGAALVVPDLADPRVIPFIDGLR